MVDVGVRRTRRSFWVSTSGALPMKFTLLCHFLPRADPVSDLPNPIANIIDRRNRHSTRVDDYRQSLMMYAFCSWGSAYLDSLCSCLQGSGSRGVRNPFAVIEPKTSGECPHAVHSFDHEVSTGRSSR